MRYTALLLILIVASETMPKVEMDEGVDRAEIRQDVVLSQVTPLAATPLDDDLNLVIAAYQPPERTPVRSGLVPAAEVLLPDPVIPVPSGPGQIVAAAKNARPVLDKPDRPLPEAKPAPAVASSVRADLRAVSASALNVRAGPSSKNRIVGALTFGDQAAITGADQGSWVQVRAIETGLEGWVYSRYLKAVDGS